MSTLKINNIADVAGTGGPDFVAMPTVGGDAVVESGSNSDGQWTKWADGTQMCRRKRLTLGFDITADVSGTWTFPLAFVDQLYSCEGTFITALDGDSSTDWANDAQPARSEIGALAQGTVTATAITYRASRILGATNFVSGDKLYISAVAIGRWK